VAVKGKSFVVFGKTDTKSVDLTNVSAGEGIIAHTIDFQGDTGTRRSKLRLAPANFRVSVLPPPSTRASK
jgi:hypothetical protein